MSLNSVATPDRPIALLNQTLADQIAAGEVVERPASVAKELVENAIDAGATRVDVELVDGGLTSIRVLDNGRGIRGDELELALTRHATSKVASPEDLVEIHSLGFRGEALASIAAVAHVTLRSRRPDDDVGHELRSLPGTDLQKFPVGMPIGTQVEVRSLFACVPARRKFMRSEATEVGHCSEALIRIALVHPEVHLTLKHGRRELLNFRPADPGTRVEHVLARRGSGPFFPLEGTADGVEVKAWLGRPEGAIRGRSGIVLVVRRRVVRERSLAQIVTQSYGERLASGHYPVACLMVEPPPGSVDVNVHPQKAEVRFREPQQVYAAVRSVLLQQLERAPWSLPSDERVWPEASTLGTPSGRRVEVGSNMSAVPADVGPEALVGARQGSGISDQGTSDPCHHGSPDFLRGTSDTSEQGTPKRSPKSPRKSLETSVGGLPDARHNSAVDNQSPETSVGGLPDARHNSAVDNQGPVFPSSVRRGSGRPVVDATGRDLNAEMGRKTGAVSTTDGQTEAQDFPREEAAIREKNQGRAGPDTAPHEPSADASVQAPSIEKHVGSQPLRSGEPDEPDPAVTPRRRGYRLATRALDGDYGDHKRAVMDVVAWMKDAKQTQAQTQAQTQLMPSERDRTSTQERFDRHHPTDGHRTRGYAERVDAAEGAYTNDSELRASDGRLIPQLLTCLPGPVAVFADADVVLAVDLKRLRSWLVFQRLTREIAWRKEVGVQRLLSPAIVRRPVGEIRLCVAAKKPLLALGIDLDAFGDDALVVRGVPAHLRNCIDDADVADLIDRVIPWLRLRAREAAEGEDDRTTILTAIAQTRGSDPAPRLARRWIAEALELGIDLCSVPGVVRWTGADLLARARTPKPRKLASDRQAG